MAAVNEGPRVDLMQATIANLQRWLREAEAEKLVLAAQIEEAEAKANQYRLRAYKAERRSIEELIYDLTYKNIDKAIDFLLAGDMKLGMVTLRHMLPAQYKHTFTKAKPVATASKDSA